jgi:uncharacterized membrane protein
MTKSDWILLGAVAVFFITGLFFYPYLPQIVASHWNTQGEVNGYVSRVAGAFMLPTIFILLAALFALIPRIDPKRENIAKFRTYFDYLVAVFCIFFYYIYLLSLLWNVGYKFSFTAAMMPALAVLFYIIGIIMPHLQPNWMMGIRTPWTLSSEVVWKKTHELGGKLFKICGILALVGTAFPLGGIWFLIGPVLAACVALLAYSYLEFEKEKK